jgi:membrane peptidoglycan carboxypeptidase
MEFYINSIYFSNGHYGIESAAQGYFGKTATELTLSQIAYLCAVHNNPSLYDPYTNHENTLNRRDRILDQMLATGNIDKEMYNEAIAEEIILSSESNVHKIITWKLMCVTARFRHLLKKAGLK